MATRDDIRQAIGEIQRSTGGIEATQKLMLAQLEGLHDRLDGHASRISSLEKWRSWLIGVGGTVIVGVGVIFKALK